MLETLLVREPWLIVIALGVLVPITGIIFGTVTHYLQSTRQAELEASLKQAMLDRGMSAEEIKMVLEATTGRKPRKRACAREGIDWRAAGRPS
jgi:hypothetical protein